LETSTVTDSTYKKTKAVLDGKDSVLVEITAILGYYVYESYTMSFEYPLE
jgi:hypothetical protein